MPVGNEYLLRERWDLDSQELRGGKEKAKDDYPSITSWPA
jgi:hypothetical protein